MRKAKKLTQKRAVFYVLWKAYKETPSEFVPAWKFVGELYVPEVDEAFLMSYKCPANGINIYFENPDLIERRMTTGRSGAKYYEYRIAPNPSVEKIKDESLREFYRQLREAKGKQIITVQEVNGERKAVMTRAE